MSAPWRQLKDAEIGMLARRRSGVVSTGKQWKDLEALFEQCRTAEDAEEAVCYQGVSALLAEQQGDIELAIKYRGTEIGKIEWLHEEELRNPTNGFQLQNYETAELEYRREIILELKSRITKSR